MAQWLGLRAANARGMGLIPGWGTKIPPATCGVAKRQKNKIKTVTIQQIFTTHLLHARCGTRQWQHTSAPDNSPITGIYVQHTQFSSVAQLCPALCNPMDCSTPGFPVHHHLPEIAQTHVHQVGDAIQPFHPLSSPSPPALNLSQHQGFFY